MDTSEILRMLLESQAATEKAAQHVIDTLFSMDKVISFWPRAEFADRNTAHRV